MNLPNRIATHIVDKLATDETNRVAALVIKVLRHACPFTLFSYSGRMTTMFEFFKIDSI